MFMCKHTSKQIAHAHNKAIEEKLKSLDRMLCMPTLEYKPASGKETTDSKEFLRPWNKTVLSRTRAQKSEVSKKTVELFQESVHSFPFSHKFKYVINKSFVCKRVYWNKKYLNGMLFVRTL